MWPFSKIKYWKKLYESAMSGWERAIDRHCEYRIEIADLKASNERLADALAAAKERAGDA